MMDLRYHVVSLVAVFLALSAGFLMGFALAGTENQTRAVTRLEEHPIRAFRDAGVTVTVNSDDPPMFGTTLNREYAIAARLLDLDEAGVAELARTAVRVSFAPDDVRDRVLGEIDAYATGQT